MKPNEKPTPTIMTRRKLRLQKEALVLKKTQSVQNIDLACNTSAGSLTSSELNLSLPDLANTHEPEFVKNLEIKLQTMQNELDSAHNEIINLNEENNRLQNEMQNLMKKIDIYKNMCTQILTEPRKDRKNLDRLFGGASTNDARHRLENCKQKLDFSEDIISPQIIHPDVSQPHTDKTIKAKIHPKNNRKLLRKIKRQNKLIKSLGKLKSRERQRLISNQKPKQKNVAQKIQQNVLSQQEKKYVNEETNYSKKTNRLLMYSDELGKGLALSINKASVKHGITNICKPQAGYENVLENLSEHTKDLAWNDIVVILLSQYRFDTVSQAGYIRKLSSIIENKARKYNVMISSIIYDHKNNDEIFKMNKQIYQMAHSNENVRVLELNGTNSRQSYIKKRIIQEVTYASKTKFTGSTCLKFINCDGGDSGSGKSAVNFMNENPIQEPI